MRTFIFLICLLNTSWLSAQQVADPEFDTTVVRPRYTADSGPVVAIDEGHHNFHTVHGRFAPFAAVLRSDGYQLLGLAEWSEDSLAAIDVLVIANPLHVSNVGNWTLPCPSAFTGAEIERLRRWVARGGRLLLIADHMPFGGAADSLARAFGAGFANGFAMNSEDAFPPDRFSRQAGTLHDHPITKGYAEHGRIDSLAAFTGSAVKVPRKAKVIATFPPTHKLLLPEQAWQFTPETPTEPLDRYVMAASLRYGKGRVVFGSEAAMFSAQLAGGQYRVGMNADGAPRNKQYVRNVLAWLTAEIRPTTASRRTNGG